MMMSSKSFTKFGMIEPNLSLSKCQLCQINKQFECHIHGPFTLEVKSVLIENLGGILGGTQCYMGSSLTISKF
jgi:hypothetical protein